MGELCTMLRKQFDCHHLLRKGKVNQDWHTTHAMFNVDSVMKQRITYDQRLFGGFGCLELFENLRSSLLCPRLSFLGWSSTRHFQILVEVVNYAFGKVLSAPFPNPVSFQQSDSTTDDDKGITVLIRTI